MQKQCLSTVCLDLDSLGSIQVTWVMSEEGWQLCFVLSTVRPHQTAYKFLKECPKFSFVNFEEDECKVL